MKRRTFVKFGSFLTLASLSGCIKLNQRDKPEKPVKTQEPDSQDTQQPSKIDDNANIENESGLNVEKSTLDDSNIKVKVRNTQESVSRVIVKVKLLNSSSEQIGLEQVTSTKDLDPDEATTVTFNPSVDYEEVSKYNVSVKGGEPL